MGTKSQNKTGELESPKALGNWKAQKPDESDPPQVPVCARTTFTGWPNPGGPGRVTVTGRLDFYRGWSYRVNRYLVVTHDEFR